MHIELLLTTHAGLTLVTRDPELDFTNSLLIKRPVGRVNCLPFGAVRSTFKSAEVVMERTTPLRLRGFNLNPNVRAGNLRVDLNILVGE